jgi:hypothetical protein
MDWLTQLQVIAEVALAILLGGVIGIERELANKPAGFRTHMLVAGSAALLVGLGEALVQRFATSDYAAIIQSDPMRIVGAIITGISFLGAGTIFRHETQVGGVNHRSVSLAMRRHRNGCCPAPIHNCRRDNSVDSHRTERLEIYRRADQSQSKVAHATSVSPAATSPALASGQVRFAVEMPHSEKLLKFFVSCLRHSRSL